MTLRCSRARHTLQDETFFPWQSQSVKYALLNTHYCGHCLNKSLLQDIIFEKHLRTNIIFNVIIILFNTFEIMQQKRMPLYKVIFNTVNKIKFNLCKNVY